METSPGTYADLYGRTALVTGASHGLGVGVARELARQGARVVVNGRDAAAIEANRAAIAATGGQAIGVPADVTDPAAVAGLRRQAEDAFGPVDLVCACAGGQGAPSMLWDLDVDAWRSTVDANLTSAFLVLREFLPGMTARRGGAVVTIASTAGQVPSPASPAYGAAKAGLLLLTRQAAEQAAPFDVRLNSIALGAVLGEKPIPAATRAAIARLHPLGRTGTSTDVAAAVAFLLSDASAWLTGATIDLNGGRFAL